MGCQSPIGCGVEDGALLMVATRVREGVVRQPIRKREPVHSNEQQESSGLRLAVVRDVFANPSDAMTFQFIAEERSDFVAFWRRGLWSPEKLGWPDTLKYCMYDEPIEGNLDLSWYNAIDVAEIYHDWTAYCVNRWPQKTFVTVWDNIPYNGWNQFSPDIISKARGFIGRSQLTCNMLEDRYQIPEEKVFWIPAAVDTNRFAPSTPDNEGNRFSDKPTILFAGRLVWEKGLLDLIYACDGMPWTLVICGSGPMEELLSQAIPEEVDVRFIGAVPHHEMPDVYRMCDIFCYPSIPTQHWVEQFGISVIEAMACGLPCVTTDVGAFHDFRAVAGAAIQLVPPMRYDMLQEALVKAIKGRRKLSRLARDMAVEHYDSKVIGERLREVYTSE